MKYYVEYHKPDDVIRPPKYNIYFKRHWWSRREVVAKDVEIEGGILSVKNYFIAPHLLKMCNYDFTNHDNPQYNKTNLKF
jgi:hypothetical protein